MFKAIKGKAPGADTKGTLTSLWKAAGKKEAGGDTPGPAQPPAAFQADRTPGAAELTPAAVDKAATEAAAGKDVPASAPRGDVAIAAIPEPSPEPAAAAVVAAPAAPAAKEAEMAESEEEAVAVVSHAPAAAAAATPAADATLASGVGGSGSAAADKKRKRGPPGIEAAWSAGQLAALQDAFKTNEYPNTTQKTALAAQIGLEVAQVNKWFEKQRKKAREQAGAAPKRGRTKAAGGGKPTAPAAAAAPAAPAGTPAAAVEGQEDMDVIEIDDDTEEAEVVSDGQKEQQGPAAELPAELSAVPANAAPAEPLLAPADATTPAAASKPAAAETAELPAAATAGAAANKPPAKTPASAAQPRSLSADEKSALVAELEAEVAALQEGGLAAPLHILPIPAAAAAATQGDGDALQATTPAAAAAAAAAVERQPFSEARLASHLAGQRLPLTQLLGALLPLFRQPDGQAALQESVLRSRVIDMASRKSHGPKDGGLAMVDALEDDALSRLWQWELRDQKHLPKEQRPAAQAAKKRAARVQERLSAVLAALSLLRSHGAGAAAPKLCKALDGLHKARTLSQIEEEQQVELEAAAAKSAAKRAASASKPGLSAEEKAKHKAEKEAEKGAAAAAKEAERVAAAAEKERLKAEKEAERERAKAEKEAEREKQKADKEAEKERKAEEIKAKKMGYKDPNDVKKSSTKFMSFFKPKPAPIHPAAAAAAAASEASPDRATGPASQQQQQQQSPLVGGGSTVASQQQSQGGGGNGGGGAAVVATTASKRERGYFELFLKPEGSQLRSLPPQPSAADAMDAASGQPFGSEQAQAAWRQLVQGMKRRRREAAAHPAPKGLPPSWARRSDARQVAQARLDKLQEGGADVATIKTWRRKLIWFSGDSKRPPYYGSATPSPAVSARNYLGRDEALDYDVMSDLDWAEEPEDACSLSDGDDASEMCGGEEEEEQDSFICADGYLSADEGVQVEDLEGMEVDMPEGLPEGAAAAAGMDVQRLLSMQLLEAQMDRARRAGKPLIISRLPTSGGGDGQQHAPGGFLQGDVSLLGALCAEVLLPGLRVGMPEDLAGETAGAAPASAAKAASPAAAAGAAAGSEPPKPSGGGRPRAERPDDLLPLLLRMVQGAPRMAKPKITELFLAAHPDRKIPKKWVADCLKEQADWKGSVTGWLLRPTAQALLAGAPLAAAAAAVAAESGGAAVAAAAGGVLPTPVATKPAAAAVGCMDRYLTAKGAVGTPAVPSALRPDAPPSEMRAPGRLVTTTAAGASAAATAAGAASPLPVLAVPESVSGTADPFWRVLLQHIEASDGSCGEQARQQQGQQLQFVSAFQPSVLARLVSGMPASILTALLTGVAAPSSLPASRAAYMRCLGAAVVSLAAAEAEAGGDHNMTASQQVWAPRGAPLAASLAELCREVQLASGLTACVQSGQGAEAGSAEVEAAQAAASVAAALMGSEACRAVLQEVDGGSSCGAGEQLAALAAAAGQAGADVAAGPSPMEA